MINLQLEILLLLPFGMFIIKAIQALTDEGGALRFLVAWAEEGIEYYTTLIPSFSDQIKIWEDEEQDNIYQERGIAELSKERKEKKLKLYFILLLTKPLYRCPVCMSSIWGTLTWLWWVQFSPLPIGTWPIYCLMLCGAMYMYENRYSPEIFIKNEVNTTDID